MTTTTTQRFVNLGKSRTQIIGPEGERLLVMPFADSLNPNHSLPVFIPFRHRVVSGAVCAAR